MRENNHDYFNRRCFLGVVATASVIGIAGCSGDSDSDGSGDESGPEQTDTSESDPGSTATEDSPGEVIFEQTSRERVGTTFQATEGDEIITDVTNGDGFRTHVVIREESYETTFEGLSEGVQDEDTFRTQVEEDGTYTIEMTPADETESTWGKVRAVLITKESSEEVTTEEQGETTEPEKEPEKAVREWILEHEQEIKQATQTFESGNDRYEAEEYASAEELYISSKEEFETLFNKLVQKSNQWDIESDYYAAYSSAAACFIEMSDTANIRRAAAANIAQHNNKPAATERWEESEQQLEDAEECRRRVKREFGIDPLKPAA